MARRQKSTTERFTKEYKRSKTDHINELFCRLMGQRHNGKDFTIHMINNWIYGRNNNQILDNEFERLMMEVDPIGLQLDKERLCSDLQLA